MLEGILVQQVVTRASPGRRNEHRIELFVRVGGRKVHALQLCIFVIFHQINLSVAFEAKKISLQHLKVFMFLQTVDLGIVAHVVYLDWIIVDADAETTLRELN